MKSFFVIKHLRLSALAVFLGFCLVVRAQQKQETKSFTSNDNSVDIYMALNIYNESTGKTAIGYWKNGTIVVCSPESHDSGVVSLMVDGNDVYMAGYYNNQAAYWKNNQLIQLTSNPNIGDAVSVMINGGHLYVAGKERKMARNPSLYSNNALDIPTLWTDGVANPLTNLTLETLRLYDQTVAGAIGMTIDNNGDVYVVGTAPGSDSNIQYWKNGKKVQELVNIPVTPANMYIFNGDFYVVGHLGRNGSAAYWKWSKGRSELVTLTTGGDSQADALFVSGNDVYVAGHEGGVGKYWKNGIPVTLAGGALYYMGKYGLAVLGSDVYVTGPDTDGKTKCWKNGKEYITLTGMSVGGIVVKKSTHGGRSSETVETNRKLPSSSPSSTTSKKDRTSIVTKNGSVTTATSPSTIDQLNSSLQTIGDIDYKKQLIIEWLKGKGLEPAVITKNTDLSSVANATIKLRDDHHAQLKLAFYGEDIPLGQPLFNELKSKQVEGKYYLDSYGQGNFYEINFDVFELRFVKNLTPEFKILTPVNYLLFKDFPRVTQISWTPHPKANRYMIVVQHAVNENHNFEKAGCYFHSLVDYATTTNYTFDGRGATIHRYRVLALNGNIRLAETDWNYIEYVH